MSEFDHGATTSFLYDKEKIKKNDVKKMVVVCKPVGDNLIIFKK